MDCVWRVWAVDRCVDRSVDRSVDWHGPHACVCVCTCQEAGRGAPPLPPPNEPTRIDRRRSIRSIYAWVHTHEGRYLLVGRRRRGHGRGVRHSCLRLGLLLNWTYCLVTGRETCCCGAPLCVRVCLGPRENAGQSLRGPSIDPGVDPISNPTDPWVGTPSTPQGARPRVRACVCGDRPTDPKSEAVPAGGGDRNGDAGDDDEGFVHSRRPESAYARGERCACAAWAGASNRRSKLRELGIRKEERKRAAVRFDRCGVRARRARRRRDGWGDLDFGGGAPVEGALGSGLTPHVSGFLLADASKAGFGDGGR